MYPFWSEPRKTSTTIVINEETGETATVDLLYADNQRVYNAIETITITINVLGAESVTTTYSIAHYITAMTADYPEVDIELTQALYEFGVSAKNYIKNLTNY